MPLSVRVVTAPTELPVSLDEAKQHLRVEHTADDALLTRMIRAAAADAGLECGRGLGVARYALTLDSFPGLATLPAVVLPVRPVLASPAVAVTYYDEDGAQVAMDAADFWVGYNTGRLFPAAGAWPATQCGRPEAVEVQFSAGSAAAAVPHQAWQAVLLILADRYEHRGDGEDRRLIPEAARRLLFQLHDGRVV